MARKRMLFSFLLFFSILMTACSAKTSGVESPEFDQAQTEFIEELNVENIFTFIK